MEDIIEIEVEKRFFNNSAHCYITEFLRKFYRKLIFNKSHNSDIFLNIDLDADERELLALIRIAKKKVKGEKDILMQCIYDILKNITKYRKDRLELEDKLSDIIFLFDAKYLNIKEHNIKNLLNNYYIENYPQIDISYISGTYFYRIKKMISNIFKVIKILQKDLQEKTKILNQ
ncbi:hypothetical protein JCM11957_04190 [Caminibacter profundus]